MVSHGTPPFLNPQNYLNNLENHPFAVVHAPAKAFEKPVPAANRALLPIALTVNTLFLHAFVDAICFAA